jgi:hypothetical protein
MSEFRAELKYALGRRYSGTSYPLKCVDEYIYSLLNINTAQGVAVKLSRLSRLRFSVSSLVLFSPSTQISLQCLDKATVASFKNFPGN